MPRSITIEVTFFNNKKRLAYVCSHYRPEYIKSRITLMEMNDCLKKIKKEMQENGNKIKRVRVIQKIYTEFDVNPIHEHCIHTYKTLNEISPKVLIDVNNALFLGFLK